jgi:hypothetical protein
VKKLILTISILGALVALGLSGTSAFAASTTDNHPNTSSIPSVALYYESEAQGRDAITARVFRPGETVSFEYPSADGTGYDTITVSGSKRVLGPDAFLYSFDWWWEKRSYFNVHIWTWHHYTEYTGNTAGCVVSTHANSQWSSFTGALWFYRGAGSYVVNTLTPVPCPSVGNTWWAGRQGHYEYCVTNVGCVQSHWPWQVSENYGWGGYRVYAYGGAP